MKLTAKARRRAILMLSGALVLTVVVVPLTLLPVYACVAPGGGSACTLEYLDRLQLLVNGELIVGAVILVAIVWVALTKPHSR